jgi:hypothetical protein
VAFAAQDRILGLEDYVSFVIAILDSVAREAALLHRSVEELCRGVARVAFETVGVAVDFGRMCDGVAETRD